VATSGSSGLNSGKRHRSSLEGRGDSFTVSGLEEGKQLVIVNDKLSIAIDKRLTVGYTREWGRMR